MNWFIYFVPPITGALIGYLTNKIAIRMLFRPLKRWQIFGFNIPMTPGVIPSKRVELARNMGKMVGKHLLTAEEISKALENESFQNHLYGLIEERVGGFINKRHNNIKEIVPDGLKGVYDTLTLKITCYFIKHIRSFLHSDDFNHIFKTLSGKVVNLILGYDLKNLCENNITEKIYDLIKNKYRQRLTDRTFDNWVETNVQKEVFHFLQAEKSIADILPESTIQFLVALLQEQIHLFTRDLSTVVKDEQVQKIIVEHIHSLVLDLIQSIGTMGNFLKNVADSPVIKKKIAQYINEHDNEIVDFFQNEIFRNHLADVSQKQILNFLHTPVVKLISQNDEEIVLLFCANISGRIIQLFNKPEVIRQFIALFAEPIENYLKQDNVSIMTGLEKLLGPDGLSLTTDKILAECSLLFQSEDFGKVVEELVPQTLSIFLNKPVDRISDFIDESSMNILCSTLQRIATQLLAIEMVGFVETLNIEEVVSNRVDSFNLDELEALLLSIMAEQFKYINLFGAIIGFLIGCCNLVLIANQQ